MNRAVRISVFAVLACVSIAVPAVAFGDAIDSLAPGHWYKAPNTKLQTVNPCPGNNCSYSGSLGVAGVMAAWSGAAFDTTRERLLVWGGGHSDYFGNELYAFDAASLTWSRLSEPATNVAGNESTGLYPDGTPRARHTRGTIAYSPEIDSFLAFGAPGTSPTACCGDAMVHRLNLSGAPAWTRMASIPTNGVHRGVTAYDPNRGVIWHQGSGPGQLGKFDPQANSWTGYASKALNIYASAAIDPTRDHMLVIGGAYGGQAIVWDLSSPNSAPLDLESNSTFNSTNAYALQTRQAPGVAFDPVADRFVLWDGGDIVYEIHPVTWAVTRVAAASTNSVVPTQADPTGTYGRFRYVPSRNAFMVVNATNQDVYFYRFAAGTGTAPPPVVTLSANSTSVVAGQNVSVTWNAINATACTASGDWSGSRPVSGNQVFNDLQSSISLTLTCTGPGGSDAETLPISVSDGALPTVSLGASSSSVLQGGSVVLTWTTSNAESCTASGGWSGSRPTSGSQSAGPLQSTSQFVLTCINAIGPASDSVSVQVNPPPPENFDIVRSLDASHNNPTPLDGATVAGPLFAFISPENGVSQVQFFLDDPQMLGAAFNIENVAPYDFAGSTGTGYDTAQLGNGTHSLTALVTLTGGGTDEVTVAFSIQNEVIQPPPQLSLSVSNPSVAYGAFTTLQWSSSNATSCEASGDWQGSRATTGSQPVGPLTEDKTYIMICSGTGGSVTRSATVIVGDPPVPSVSLTANPASVAYGGSSTLNWSSSNATSCTANGSWSGPRPLSGSESIGPLTAAATFTLVCTGPGGNASNSVNVSVAAPPAPTLTFTASPNPTNYNGGATLNWSSTGASSCAASGGWSGNRPPSGSLTVGPLTTSTGYTLNCSGDGGNITRTVTVAVDPAPAPTLTLSATPSSVAYLGAAVLSWTSSNAQSCSASGAWSGARGTSGTVSTGALTSTSVFTLVCTGAGGSATRNATVNVAPAPAPVVNFTAQPGTVDFGGAALLSWSVQNAQTCQAGGAWSGARALAGSQTVGPLTSNATYTLTCDGAGGTGSRSVTVSVNPAAPVVTLSAVPDEVAFDGSTMLTWSVSSATSCAASGGWSGTRATSGSQVIVSLTANATFTLTCNGPGGSDAETVSVTVAAPGAPSLSLQASPGSVVSGASATMSWDGTNLANCTASGAWSGGRSASGSETVGPLTADSTFVLSCSGPGGNISRTATITVLPPAPSVSISATPDAVAFGGVVELSWSASDAQACNAYGGWAGSKSASGTQTISNLAQSTTFSLVCTGAGGSGGDAVSVTVGAATPPVLTLDAAPSQVDTGGTSTLTWTTENTTSCQAVGSWFGPRPVSGSEQVGPLSADGAYSLVCNGPGGQISETVFVTVNQSAPTLSVTASPQDVDYGGTTTITWSSTNASQCSAFGAWSGTRPTSGSETVGDLTKDSNFILVCSGSGGSASASAQVTVSGPTPPEVTLMASPTQVDFDGTSVLSWTSDNATSCNAYGAWFGERETDGTETVGPLSNDSSFVLLCAGPGGSTARTVTVAVSNSPQPEIVFSAAPASVPFGGSSTLSWSTNYSDSCSASGDWSGSLDGAGNLSVGPLYATSSYTIVCTGPGGGASRSVTVQVADPPSLPLENFESIGLGAAVPGWYQSGAEYSSAPSPLTFVVGTQNGNRFLRMDKVGNNYHSHYLQGDAESWRDYRYTGRLYVSAASDQLGVTLLSGYPADSAYYRFAYEGSGAFKLTAHGTDCAGTLSSSVVPVQGQWYRFKVEAQSSGNATELRARVWAEGAAEPSTWQSQCQDNGAERRLTGTPGLWASRSGESNDARWDDLMVTPLDSDLVFPPTLALTASPPVVETNGFTTLNWSANNAASCEAGGDWTGPRGLSGSELVGPIGGNSSFTLVCDGPGGSITRAAAVAVTSSSALPVVTISANPDTVPAGGATTLTWSASNAAVCAASGDWAGIRSPSGSQLISGIVKDSLYGLTCIGQAGTANAEVVVALSDIPRDPLLEMDVDFSLLPINNTVKLSWESRYTDSCSASGSWSGAVATSGSQTVGPIEVSETYVLTCSGRGGSIDRQVTVSFIDADGDNMPDVWEQQFFGNLTNTGTGDTDGDGLSDSAEYAAGTNPFSVDTDGDGASDFDEVSFGSNPRDPLDTFSNNQPRQPEFSAVANAPLWGATLDVNNGYLDPDGDALASAEWQLALDAAFKNRVFERIVPGSTSCPLPAGILDPGVVYHVRTRHVDSTGVPSDWSDTETLTARLSYPNDSDGDGIDDDSQAPAGADANGNGVADGDEGICNLIDAEGASLLGMQTNSGVVRCYRSLPASAIPSSVNVGGDLPYGLFSFRVEGLYVDPESPASVFVTVWLGAAIDPDSGWVLWDAATGVLVDFSSNVTIQGDRAVIRYTDGGLGDKDGVVNGIIVDPSGPRVVADVAPPPPAPSPKPTGDNSSGGGGAPAPVVLIMLCGLLVRRKLASTGLAGRCA